MTGPEQRLDIKVHPAWRLLHRFKSEWPFAMPVLAVCCLGMGYGWYYYWQVGQFDASSPHSVHWSLWPLVSDSPNAVLVYFGAVIAYLFLGWRHWLVDSAAFVLNMYIGFWTTFLFIAYPDQLNTYDWAGALAGDTANPILFLSHMGMPLLSLTLVHDLRVHRRRGWGYISLVLAAMVVYIMVDYWGPHIHPAPFLHPDDGALHAVAPWLMVATLAAWLAVVWPTPSTRSMPSPPDTRPPP